MILKYFRIFDEFCRSHWSVCFWDWNISGLSENVVEISKIREITELNIGHFIIGQAIYMGIGGAIKKMRSIIDKSRVE